MAGQADLLGLFGRQQRRLHHRLAGDGCSRYRVRRGRILVHKPGQKSLVERAPVDTDANRFVMFQGRFDDGGELAVLLFLKTHIARVDPVLGERLGAGRMVGKELVADIVEVADQRHVDPEFRQSVADMGYGSGGLVPVDGHAYQFRPGPRQGGNLCNCRFDVGCVGIGHRLDDDRCRAADGDAANGYGDGFCGAVRGLRSCLFRSVL